MTHMSFAAPALLAAAAGVGLGHAILPDHWVPLSVIARTQRYPLRRVLRLSGLAGLAHVSLSLILGAVIIGVGVQFRSTVERHENLIVGGLLIATGAVFLVLELRGRGHGHTHDEHGGHSQERHRPGRHHDHQPAHEHDHVIATLEVPTSTPRHEHSASGAARVLAFAVPFGAAASPDLTILPVFLAAGAVGLATAISTLIVFSLVTVGAIVGLTVLGALAGHQLRGGWVDKSANVFTAGVLLIIGVLVAGSII